MTAKRLFSRAIIRLSSQDAGEDVAAFLQGLVTNDVTGDLPVWSALLSPQGKSLFDFIVWPGAEGDLLIDCEAEFAGDLVKRLSLYRLRRKIEIRVDETLGVFWQPDIPDGGTADPRLTALGHRSIAPVPTNDASTDENGDTEWQRHRLSLGVPEGSAELGDILWLETNAVELNGVSFDKGCYIGQENTARMNWRQKVNRRLVVVPADQSQEKRRKAVYPELGYAVDHLRIADIDPAVVPDWMKLSAD